MVFHFHVFTILAPFYLHFELKMGDFFVPKPHFFHFGRHWGPNWTPREAKAPKWSRKESPRAPKATQKSSQTSTLGTKTDPKRGQGTQKDPNDITKVVTKVKSSQKSSQTIKHGGGTGVSHWINLSMLKQIPIFIKIRCSKFSDVFGTFPRL